MMMGVADNADATCRSRDAARQKRGPCSLGPRAPPARQRSVQPALLVLSIRQCGGRPGCPQTAPSWRSRSLDLHARSSSAAAARPVSARTAAPAVEACATSCCSASRRNRSSGAPPDAQARRSRAAHRASDALRRRARFSRAARPLRLRRSRGGRRGGSRVLGAARAPRGRQRRRRVRPGAGAAGRRGGR
jgi:hypothetical protein